MNKDNTIPITSLALVALSVLYLLAISGQARMADGGLTGDEMNVGEMVLTSLVTFSIFATIFVGARRAYCAGNMFWFFVCLFAWPLAYIYTLVVNRTDWR